MRVVMAMALVASVNLGGSFGEASGATVTLGSETMVVDLEVEVLVSAQSVVVHLSLLGDDRTIPLLGRGGGVYGIRTELPRKDYVVVFEAVTERGDLSAPTTLSSLGVQLSVMADTTLATGEDDDGLSPGTRRWGWLALGLAAASLSVLALWVVGGRREANDESAAAEEE